MKLVAELEKAPLKIKTELASVVFGSQVRNYSERQDVSFARPNINLNHTNPSIIEDGLNQGTNQGTALVTDQEKNKIFSQAIEAMEGLGFNRSQVFKSIMEKQREAPDITLEDLIKETLKAF